MEGSHAHLHQRGEEDTRSQSSHGQRMGQALELAILGHQKMSNSWPNLSITAQQKKVPVGFASFTSGKEELSVEETNVKISVACLPSA